MPGVCHHRGRASPGWRPRVVRHPSTSRDTGRSPPDVRFPSARSTSETFLVQEPLGGRLVETPEEHHRPSQIAPLPDVRCSLESPERLEQGGEDAPDHRALVRILRLDLVIVADREPDLFELRAAQRDRSVTRLDGQRVVPGAEGVAVLAEVEWHVTAFPALILSFLYPEADRRRFRR